MKRYIIIFSLGLGLVACNNSSNKETTVNADSTQTTASADNASTTTTTATEGAYRVNGIIKNSDGAQVFLDQIFMQSSEIMGSAQPDASGKFSIPVDKYTPGVYRIRQGQQNYLSFIISEQQDINLEIDFQNPKASKFGGAPETYGLLPFYGKEVSPKDIKRFVDTTQSPLAAWFLARMTNPQADDNLDTWKKALEKLQKKYPSSPYTTEMQPIIVQIDGQLNSGKVAPDFSLPNPDGQKISLSSLRGKVVLLDFWASWCRPCRAENPNVVAAYNKYKGKGFTVMSVSLDKEKSAWVQAIQQDGLIWPNHVSELQAWNGPLNQLYGIQSIPKTFLLDRKGRIVAQDLRGPALEAKLKEIL
jgi:peroxiredoxin